jgi:hypothetical protein
MSFPAHFLTFPALLRSEAHCCGRVSNAGAFRVRHGRDVEVGRGQDAHATLCVRVRPGRDFVAAGALVFIDAG